jgi:hypothetical protein
MVVFVVARHDAATSMWLATHNNTERTQQLPQAPRLKDLCNYISS